MNSVNIYLLVLLCSKIFKARPHLSFNKEGSILAVFADHNKIKILANDVGQLVLQTSKCGSGNPPGFLSQAREKVMTSLVVIIN